MHSLPLFHRIAGERVVIVGSGGMPSSHTALVVGLCTSIGLKEGMQSSIFALCLVFSLVVMYDATGVRLHAGRQAEVLNQLIVNQFNHCQRQLPCVIRGKLFTCMKGF